MAISIVKGCFDGLPGALEDIRRNELWPTTYVSGATPRAPVHWHSEDVSVYVMKGTTYFLDAQSGRKHHVMPGDKALIPARTLHAEGDVEDEAIYIIGLAQALGPDRFLRPRAPEELDQSESP